VKAAVVGAIRTPKGGIRISYTISGGGGELNRPRDSQPATEKVLDSAPGAVAGSLGADAIRSAASFTCAQVAIPDDRANRIYVGEIRHKQQSHPGQHEPIMSRELWELVQAKLCGHAVRDGDGRTLTPAQQFYSLA